MLPKHRFLVVVTGYNCADKVRRCYESIRKQTFTNFECVFVFDGSTDRSLKEYNQCPKDSRFTYYYHIINEGAAKRRYEVISKHGNPLDVVVLVGMDDELLPDALYTIYAKYCEGKWMTYGNWIDQKGEMLDEDFELDFDEETHASRDYRKVKYRSTAPNTFLKYLFMQIPVDDFKINGKWIDSTTESEVMFSCLEMCGKERIGIIETPIYLYNRNLRNGTLRRLGVKYKYNIYEQIIARPKRPLITNLELHMENNLNTATKTTKSKWESATQNLINRRATGVKDNAKCDTIVADYGRHLRSFELGNSVLDIGCGDQSIKRLLHVNHPHVKYTGIDAFPINDEVINAKIETLDVKKFEAEHGTHDTIVCFAALDSMHDLVKACDNMKKLAKKNIVFLTGIGIEVDEFHTFKITTELLNELMKGWKVNMSNFLTPNVLLVEYVPNVNEVPETLSC
jgi:glycosyltransferase involved in cell wall biosynthesis